MKNLRKPAVASVRVLQKNLQKNIDVLGSQEGQQKNKEKSEVVRWAINQLEFFWQDHELAEKYNTNSHQRREALKILEKDYSPDEIATLMKFGITDIRHILKIHKRPVKALKIQTSHGIRYSYRFADSGTSFLGGLNALEKIDLTNSFGLKKANSVSEKFRARLNDGEIVSLFDFIKSQKK